MGKVASDFFHKARGRKVTFLLARDGGNCTICGDPLDRKIKNPRHLLYVTFDHIVPRSQGGTDKIDNLRLAHAKCNWERGNDPIHPSEEKE